MHAWCEGRPRLTLPISGFLFSLLGSHPGVHGGRILVFIGSGRRGFLGCRLVKLIWEFFPIPSPKE